MTDRDHQPIQHIEELRPELDRFFDRSSVAALGTATLVFLSPGDHLGWVAVLGVTAACSQGTKQLSDYLIEKLTP